MYFNQVKNFKIEFKIYTIDYSNSCAQIYLPIFDIMKGGHIIKGKSKQFLISHQNVILYMYLHFLTK